MIWWKSFGMTLLCLGIVCGTFFGLNSLSGHGFNQIDFLFAFCVALSLRLSDNEADEKRRNTNTTACRESTHPPERA